MSPYVRMVVSSCADFFLSLGGVLTGAMVQQGQVLMPSKGVWLLAVIAGGAAFWTNVKSSLAAQPK